MKMIYADFAASTPLDPRVTAKMHTFLSRDDLCGNASSTHEYGKIARKHIEEAREAVASLFNVDPITIIWTSGATESINMAIKGAVKLHARKGKHIVTMKTEHKAGLDACQHLEKEGYQVTYLSPERSGMLDLEKFKAAIREDTCLASIMHVNNETGVIQDIDAISKITSDRGILFHVDAVQSVGKIQINLNNLNIDLLSFNAHKVYGPKGIGGLYLRQKPRVRVEPLIHGGGHEQGMRSGTLPTHQIIGLSYALLFAISESDESMAHLTMLKSHFLNGLKTIPYIKENASHQNLFPNIINLRFEGRIANDFFERYPHIMASTSSACSIGTASGSHVLRAMGLTQEEINASMRFSFGKVTQIDEVDEIIKVAINYFS